MMSLSFVCAGYGLAVEKLHASLSGQCIVPCFWSYASHLTQRWQSARLMQILVCDVRPGFIMLSAPFDNREVCHAFKIMEVKVELNVRSRLVWGGGGSIVRSFEIMLSPLIRFGGP